MSGPHPLDQAIAGLGAAGKGRWAGASVANLVATEVILLIAQVVADHGSLWGTVVDLIAEVALLAAFFTFSRPLALACGGWANAFAVGRLRIEDAKPLFGWLLVQFGARIATGIVLVAVLPKLRHGESSSNLQGVRDLPASHLALFAFAAIVLAPIAEELVFRGLVLRAVMRRFGFWPGALVSSLLFGLFHAHEGHDATTRIALIMTMTVFGTIQCMFTRSTGRLAPNMAVHGLSNALALAATLG